MYQMYTLPTLNSHNVICQMYSILKKRNVKPAQKLMANIMHKEKAEQFLANCLYPRLLVDTTLGQWL